LTWAGAATSDTVDAAAWFDTAPEGVVLLELDLLEGAQPDVIAASSNPPKKQQSIRTV